MALVGAMLGLAILYGGLFIAQPFIDDAFGLWIPIEAPSLRDAWMMAAVVLAGACVSLVPAWRAYRISVTDGMMVTT